MLDFKWLDKCLVATMRPDSLLYGEGGSRMLKPDMQSSPFLRSVSPMPLGRRSRCCNFMGMFLFVLLFFIFAWCMQHYWHFWPDSKSSYQHYEEVFVEGVSNDTLSSFLFELTKNPHIAGSRENFDLADYIYGNFENYGISTRFVDYDVLLSYPVYRSLSLTGTDGFDGGFDLKEEVVEGDPYTKNSKIISTFHAYAASGNVSGEVVYANYGREEDFKVLVDYDIDITGAIVIARYGEIFRGDIVANAAHWGAIGVVIFSDPADYAYDGKEGYYPTSEWLPPTGVQRGSLLSSAGDPLTPGWASTPGAERVPLEDVDLPKIPSLPISGADAWKILHGLEGRLAPAGWCGSLKDVNYTVGRGPGRLNLTYVARKGVYTIRNVVGVIEGSEEPDRFVVLGNHRDAWVFGAVDPSSGTTALLEMARGFGRLLGKGWKPRRSIILGSWDAEEYGLIGSTEWVEQNLGMLSARAVAYINVDCAVAGPGFSSGATPQLDAFIQEVTKSVSDPEGQFATVFDAWQSAAPSGIPTVERLGGGDSDYASFLQFAGIPAADLTFGSVLPVYHSIYDNYNWMKEFGDPGFHRHVAVTTIWGIMALRLADSAILPFDYLAYAKELQNYAHAISEELESVEAPSDVVITPLHSAIVKFLEAAAYIKQESHVFKSHRPNARDFLYILLRRRAVNDRLMLAERSFLDSDGLPGFGRSWYKHMVYGPAAHNNYGSTNFPGIMDLIGAAYKDRKPSSWRALQHEIWRVARVVDKVALVLRDNLP